ncbi:unnamed protein product, partial [Mycena citricolor]
MDACTVEWPVAQERTTLRNMRLRTSAGSRWMPARRSSSKRAREAFSVVYIFCSLRYRSELSCGRIEFHIGSSKCL